MGPVCQDILQSMIESLSIRNVTATRVPSKPLNTMINYNQSELMSFIKESKSFKQSKSFENKTVNMGPVCQDVLQSMIESLSIRNVTATRVPSKPLNTMINYNQSELMSFIKESKSFKQSKSFENKTVNLGPVCQDVLQSMIESLSLRNVTATKVPRKTMEYIRNEHREIEVNMEMEKTLASVKYYSNGIPPENIGELLSKVSSLLEYLEEYKNENIVSSDKELKPVIKNQEVTNVLSTQEGLKSSNQEGKHI